jgi:hypothetical protein
MDAPRGRVRGGKNGWRARLSGSSKSGNDAKTERERRLAEALRSNLKRRKAQARKRDFSQTAAEEQPECGRR